LKPGHFSDFIVCSCWLSYLAGRAGRRPAVGCSEKLPQAIGVDDPSDAQRAPEGAATLGERETGRIGVQMRSSTRPDMRRIGLDDDQIVPMLDRDDSQQL
jgi:hypothetical protein